VLPELVRVRNQTEAAPVRGAHYLAGIRRVELREPSLELLARLDRLALVRDRGADLAPARSCCPIRIGHGLWSLLDPALDSDLTAGHVDEDRRPRVLGQLPPLAALVAREEEEAALVRLLEEHHAHRWS